MRIVFMGTPDFAVKGLEAIHQAGHEILLVISQEDKAKDRKGNLLKTPVKQAAERLELPVRSVHRLRKDEELLAYLKDLTYHCAQLFYVGEKNAKRTDLLQKNANLDQRQLTKNVSRKAQH